MTGFIGELTGANAAKRASQQATMAAQREADRQAAVTSAAGNVNSTFDSQFTPDFYQQQRQNYINFAKPQLDQQYGDAQKALTFALDRSGQLNSSSRSAQLAKLQGSYDANLQGIDTAADQQASNIRNNVEGSRSNLISTLNASGDTTGAVNNAVAQATSLSATPTYSPLGQLFGDTTSALATQAALDKQNTLTGGNLASPYSLGLNAFKNAVSVSR